MSVCIRWIDSGRIPKNSRKGDCWDDAVVAQFNGGKTRKRARDKGCTLAGKSTLNRLELTPFDADHSSRYKKIVARPGAMDDLLADLFLELLQSQ